MTSTHAPPDPTFLDLERVHGRLEALFLQHQAALMAGRHRRAIAILEAYASAWRVHVRHEEPWLLPVYEQRREHDAPGPVGAASLFSAEHQRILCMLDDILAAVRELARDDAPPVRDVIRLLDNQCTFKHLVQHHHMREHNILYPGLDPVTTADERNDWIERCTEESAASLAHDDE